MIKEEAENIKDNGNNDGDGRGRDTGTEAEEPEWVFGRKPRGLSFGLCALLMVFVNTRTLKLS